MLIKMIVPAIFVLADTFIKTLLELFALLGPFQSLLIILVVILGIFITRRACLLTMHAGDRQWLKEHGFDV